MHTPYHIEFLKDELARRQRKNSKYSLRAFAGHLKIQPSALSRILTNKKDISLATCVRIVKVIEFSEEDKVHFLLSVSEERMFRAAAFLAAACGLGLPIVHSEVHTLP
jgi:plasmid maintenance system antidote protein VapI